MKSMSAEVLIKMNHIQDLFLKVQDYIQSKRELDELITFLDSETPEFRSIAYESASMQISLQDLSLNNELLNDWKNFLHHSREIHPFHIYIGLGWTFAKLEILPAAYLKSIQPMMRWMIFDGIGYYNGLFKGRRTIKNQMVPEGIDGQDLQGYDQGLGRRLWYFSKGEVKEVVQLIESFPTERQADLWRGVGVACGYVGGNDIISLKNLVTSSAIFKQQLSSGVALAAISRNVSGSITRDIENACKIICGMPLKDVLNIESDILKQSDSLSSDNYKNWITQFETKFI